MTLTRFSIGSLLFAAVFSLVAWALQSSALSDLNRAREIQAADVPESGGEPPDIKDYEAILATLQQSIEIRRDIDSRLSEVEAILAELREQQDAATSASELASGEIATIAEVLGGAITAAGDSVEGLDGLAGKLEVSQRLARLIAEELEELDRSMGP